MQHRRHHPNLVGDLDDHVGQAARRGNGLRENGGKNRDVTAKEVRLDRRSEGSKQGECAASDPPRQKAPPVEGSHGATFFRHRSAGRGRGGGTARGTGIVTASLSSGSATRC